MKDMELPDMINSKSGFKRKFGFFELYRALVFLPRAMLTLIGNSKSKLVNPQFIERLQLAITEVNGCAACSYHHTKMVLRQGMSNEEISSILSGGSEFIMPNGAKAIFFAQHFAESKGFTKKYAHEAIEIFDWFAESQT